MENEQIPSHSEQSEAGDTSVNSHAQDQTDALYLNFPENNNKKEENQMHFKTAKEAYIFGIKEGMLIGIDKGMDFANMWCEGSSECPPANTEPQMIEGSSEQNPG